MWEQLNIDDLAERVAAGDGPAYESFTTISRSNAHMIPQLLRHLDHVDRSVRQAVAIGLTNFLHTDFEPTWGTEDYIIRAISNADDDLLLKSALFSVLGAVGTDLSLRALFDFGSRGTGFISAAAFRAIGASGALGYKLIDKLAEHYRQCDDEEIKASIAVCICAICDEVRALASGYKIINLEELFFGSKRYVTIPKSKEDSLERPDGIKCLYDGRIHYSVNGSDSSCRLILLFVKEQRYCVFSRDEFSFGTGPTNSIETLISAAVEHFGLTEVETIFLDRYERGQIGRGEGEMSIVISKKGHSPEWIGGIMMHDVEGQIVRYFDGPVPVPDGFNLNEHLLTYLPPSARERSH